MLKQLVTARNKLQMSHQKHKKDLEKRANIHQKLICLPYHLVTTEKNMSCLARLADEEEKLVRKIVIPSFISEENLLGIIEIANHAGFEIIDQVPECSRGHQFNIHPNITKHKQNDSCYSSHVVMEDTFCQLPLLSEYEQHNNSCYSSHVVMEDRLSQLPDEILVSILSQLTLREAVRTSSLSSRWRYLWMHVTCLNFDVFSEFGDKALNLDFCEKEGLRHINWINHVLDLRRSHTLEEFSVCLPFEGNFKCEIDKWLKFASSKKVESLELFLLIGYWVDSDRYSIPLELLSHGSNDASLFGFGALKSLTLADIDVCNQVAEIFLSSCPLLEQLSIINSRVLEHLIIGPSLKLKHLEIYRCRIDYLEICNANLISFSFKGTKLTNLSLENVSSVSSVVNLQIEIYRESLPILIDLIATKFSEVEKLSLEVSCGQLRALDFHHSFPKFNNLKWLILSVVDAVDCTLLEVTPLLQASPYLQMFEIKIDWSDTRIYGGTILPLPRHILYQHLKVVRYEG
ncbi:f-boxlrr-repeat protein [Nicotiana attenuata]|uniref:F-boxlrr-repeat protein n=1 Tax=Nicotiana attenuata TaxID=49451 RepID=A0A314LFQ4_NICAT|nr:f-boxlrr-repeat protein [Nicotiana attenuata]